MGRALGHVGIVDRSEQQEVRRHLQAAGDALDAVRELVRQTPPDDPYARPAYGALIIDAHRMVRGLDDKRQQAVLPTDSGPGRLGRSG